MRKIRRIPREEVIPEELCNEKEIVMKSIKESSENSNEISKSFYEKDVGDIGISYMLEDMSKTKREVLQILVMNMTKNNYGQYELIMMNKNIPKLFKGINPNTVKAYISDLNGDVIESLDQNPFTKAKSKKFRIIKMDSEIAEKIIDTMKIMQ